MRAAVIIFPGSNRERDVCAALARAMRVVATSETTARHLAVDYAVPADRIVVARPGTDAAPRAGGSGDGIVRLLAVGAVVPRKGYDVLIAALAGLADLPWRLSIAGDRGRDPQTAARLDEDIARRKLNERIVVLGAVPSPRLAELYVGADLFVLASRFEGYGMAYAEAIAHGLPVIGTATGATSDTVPYGAGILVAPDDPVALAAAVPGVYRFLLNKWYFDELYNFVFVRPTLADGDAVSVREALALGRVVVASAVGERPAAARLFPAGDAAA